MDTDEDDKKEDNTMKPLINFDDTESNAGQEFDYLTNQGTAEDKTPTLANMLSFFGQNHTQKDKPPSEGTDKGDKIPAKSKDQILQPSTSSRSLPILPARQQQPPLNQSSNILILQASSSLAHLPNPTSTSNLHRLCGLQNNNCFPNVCFQFFYTASPTLRSHFIDFLSSPRIDKIPLHQSLGLLFDRMQKTANVAMTAVVNPSFIFTDCFRKVTSSFDQQDAYQCLTLLLDLLHQEVNEAYADVTLISSEFFKPLYWGGSVTEKVKDVAPKSSEEAWHKHKDTTDDSFFSALFMGQIELSLTFEGCKHTKKSWTAFWKLQLDLPPFSTSLAELLDSFNDTVHFSPDDESSPKCTARRCRFPVQQSTQKTVFSRAPSELLLLHLKRFDSTGHKNNTSVHLDERLIICDSIFALHSVILHTGSTEKGNYILALKVSQNKGQGDHWMFIDDDKVYECGLIEKNMATYLAQSAYMCLYKVVEVRVETKKLTPQEERAAQVD